MVTVFTPTYNRAKLLCRLYESLLSQTSYDFEWLIIDDGSTDDTEQQVTLWQQQETHFPICYHKVHNGGKMRAINTALDLAKGEYFCGIDSDDWFQSEAMQTIIDTFHSISREDGFIGVGMVRYNPQGVALGSQPNFPNGQDYVDCTNLERKNFGLGGEMVIAFYTDLQRKYKIPIWDGETFTPESIFLDAMAQDGWKVRWLSAVLGVGDYESDGLTRNSWRLMRDNPMGYAMMYNMQLRKPLDLKDRINTIIQFINNCCLKGEYGYILKCHNRIGSLLLFVPGYLLSLRRKQQFKKYCN